MTTLSWSYWLYGCALALGCLLSLTLLFGGDGGDAGEPGDADDPDLEQAWLSAFGVGRMPLGALLTIDLLLFGGLGLIGNEVFSALLPSAGFVVALSVAFVAAPLLGARIARLLARRLPSVESHGVTRSALIGQLGHAELTIDQRFGRARIRDEGGALHQVRCVTHGAPIARGEELVVTDFDAETGVYAVERADL